MSLIKYEQVSPKLQGTNREIVQASLSKTFREVFNDAELKKLFVASVSSWFEKAPSISGFKNDQMNARDRGIAIREICNCFKGYLWMGLEESEFVFSMGLRGDLGDTYGFNAKAVNTWLRTYSQGIRLKAVKIQNDYLEESKEIDRKAEEAKRERFYTRRMVDKINGIMGKTLNPDIYNYPNYYDFLVRVGIIEFYDGYFQATVESYFKKISAGKTLLKRPEMLQAEARLRAKDFLFRVWVYNQTIPIDFHNLIQIQK